MAQCLKHILDGSLASEGWSKNPPDGRTIAFRKDPTGPATLRRSLTTTEGKTVNFTMLQHHESCTNATGSENGEPGRLNRRNRAYGRGDMAVRSIAGKTGLSGKRPHFKHFGAGLILEAYFG